MATLPCPPRAHQTGHTQRAVLAEDLRIDEQVVDPPVDHVHPLETVDGAHVDALVVADDEVDAFHERRTDALGEERVLEVGRVVDARGEHGDRRLGHAVGRQRREHAVQLVGVRVDRKDALLREEIGERALADRPVLEHVADAAGHAQIVFEHIHGAVAVAHEIAATDVGPHPELRVDPDALVAEVHGVLEQFGREHAVADDPLLVVHVVDEHVDRARGAAGGPVRCPATRRRR